MIFDNLFVNGGLALWNRIDPHEESPCREEIVCSRWRQTFLADRWKVRYDQATGSEIFQRRSREVSVRCRGEYSIELQGQDGVLGNVYLGQRIEAGESLRYRRRLRFSAEISFSEGEGADVSLLVETAHEQNRFGGALNPTTTRLALLPLLPVGKVGEWNLYEAEFDASSATQHGLSVELVFSAESLNSPNRKIRVCSLTLADADLGVPPSERNFAAELQLASRFFQRYSSETLNCVGRAINVDADNLYFQLSFPEMRGAPTVVLPLDDEALKVYGFPYREMSGFRYEMIFRSRSSVIIKAFKVRHGLTDGYLSFVNTRGAILLDAEL